MVSLVAISAGHARNYFQENKDELYYTKDASGKVYGEQSREFGGPDTEITKEQFKELVDRNEEYRNYTLKVTIDKRLLNLLDYDQNVDDFLLQVSGEAFSEFLNNHYPGVIRFANFQRDLHNRLKPRLSENKGSFIVEIETNKVFKKNWEKVKSDQKLDMLTRCFQDTLSNKLSANLSNSTGLKASLEEATGRIGWDLTFSPPKSLSIAMHYGDDYYRIVRESHTIAVKKALDYIERNLIYTRTQDDKVKYLERTGQMLAVIFEHFTSRESDPQYHSHVVIPKQTIDHKGNKKSIESFMLFKNKKLVDGIYMNELAFQLKARGLPFNSTNHRRSWFEVDGISREVIEQYSKRRADILDWFKEKNINSSGVSFEASQNANLSTRSRKPDIDLESWRAEISEEIRNHPDINLSLIKPYNHNEHTQQSMIEQALYDLENSTAAFTKEEFLLSCFSNSSTGSITLEDAESYFRESPEIRFAGVLNGESYYTTPRSIRIENDIYTNMSLFKNNFPGINNIDELLDNTILNKGQSDAVKLISSRETLSIIIGDAGTGKTFMLGNANQIFEQKGYKMQALAPTRVAVNELEDAGITSTTISSFLIKEQIESKTWSSDKNPLDPGTFDLSRIKKDDKLVLVLDEAGMVRNIEMAKLMQVARMKNCKIVLVGDDKQLSPVGAGKAFRDLLDDAKIKRVRISENLRQKEVYHVFGEIPKEVITDIKKMCDNQNAVFRPHTEPFVPKNIIDGKRFQEQVYNINGKKIVYYKDSTLRDAVNAAAQENVHGALKILENHIKVVEKEKLIESISKEYVDEHYFKKSAVIAFKNDDRTLINEQIRAFLKEKGHIENGVNITVKNSKNEQMEKEFSTHDRIIFLRNGNIEGSRVANGEEGIITRIDDKSIEVRINKRSLKFDHNQYRYFDHSYARTVYKVQGATLKSALLYLPSDSVKNRNSIYVMLSRAKEEISIYTESKSHLFQHIAKQQSVSLKDFEAGYDLNLPHIKKSLSQSIQDDLEKSDIHLEKASRFHFLSMSASDMATNSMRNGNIQEYNRLQELREKMDIRFVESYRKSMDFFDRANLEYSKRLSRNQNNFSPKELEVLEKYHSSRTRKKHLLFQLRYSKHRDPQSIIKELNKVDRDLSKFGTSVARIRNKNFSPSLPLTNKQLNFINLHADQETILEVFEKKNYQKGRDFIRNALQKNNLSNTNKAYVHKNQPLTPKQKSLVFQYAPKEIIDAVNNSQNDVARQWIESFIEKIRNNKPGQVPPVPGLNVLQPGVDKAKGNQLKNIGMIR